MTAVNSAIQQPGGWRLFGGLQRRGSSHKNSGHLQPGRRGAVFFSRFLSCLSLFLCRNYLFSKNSDDNL